MYEPELIREKEPEPKKGIFQRGKEIVNKVSESIFEERRLESLERRGHRAERRNEALKHIAHEEKLRLQISKAKSQRQSYSPWGSGFAAPPRKTTQKKQQRNDNWNFW
jgi:hypothetical protein